MKITTNALINVLKGQTSWVESSYLAEIFRVTSRTIRNYINKINNESPKPLIESSYRGYRLIKTIDSERVALPDKQENRSDYVIRKLISSPEPINIYDLADELFVSDSTLESDIKQARSFIKYYGLGIKQNRDKISITGSELNKRKLINHLISIENPNNFIAFTNADILSGDYQSSQLLEKVTEIFHTHNLYINDYGLNNIILHLIVLIDRIKKGQSINKKVVLAKIQNTKDYFIAKEIKKLIEKEYDIKISDAELYYLTLIISSNSNTQDYSFVTKNNLTEYIDKQNIQITHHVIHHLEDAYFLDRFDDDFILKMTIHIDNLFRRASNGVFVHNPLTKKIKNTYPLIYDMAVFIANDLYNINGTLLNEDEIAFLAFHIGAYFENNKLNNEKVTCIFLYAEYHGLHQIALNKIQKTFQNDIKLITVASVADIKDVNTSADLIFSPVKITFPVKGKVIIVNPFLTEKDINFIRSEIDNVMVKKQNSLMYSTIRHFLEKRLFKKEFYAKNEYQMIEKLTAECYNLGLCDYSFEDEVVEREKLSSTSFGNAVAVPHSLQQNALHSFLSVVINKKPMQWGKNQVNIIVLIGINKSDRKSFRELFDKLITVLNEPINVSKLIRCKDYSDFIKELTNLMK